MLHCITDERCANFLAEAHMLYAECNVLVWCGELFIYPQKKHIYHSAIEFSIPIGQKQL